MPPFCSTELFRHIVEQSHDFTYTLAVDGTILYASPNCFELFGYQTEEMIGQPFGRFLEAEDLEQETASLRQTLASGASIAHHELRLRLKDGTLRWFSINCSPVKDATGALCYLVGSAHDITPYNWPTNYANRPIFSPLSSTQCLIPCSSRMKITAPLP